MSSFIHPAHYVIVRREGTFWYFSKCSEFYNPKNVPVSVKVEDRLSQHGFTLRSFTIELFRFHGGRAGYYIGNLREKKYYYCGMTLEDVKAKFLDLGIGRRDPHDELGNAQL